MKNQKGITLLALVIYIIVATIIISTIAFMSSKFYSNVEIIKNEDKYAVEFNKFNMFFINDVKSYNDAQVEPTKITFENGAVYELKGTDIYRDDTIIASQIQAVEFTEGEYEVVNNDEPEASITKKLINVHLTIGKQITEGTSQEKLDKALYTRFDKTIEYVLKYW